MIIQKDEIPSFLPDKPHLIFLGTMCAMNARTLNGKKPKEDFFYYNDYRNHFWKILQYIYEPSLEPVRLSIAEKKLFLLKHNIGIQNLVAEIKIPNHARLDPSDTVLFDCQKKKKIQFKKIKAKHKSLFNSSQLFFTCRYKKGISHLLEGFIETNSLNKDIVKNTWYLKTPTRCNPFQRSQEWAYEMEHYKFF